jgi:hypothetical protein
VERKFLVLFLDSVEEQSPVLPMAQKIPGYYRFPGTNFSCYEIYFGRDGQGNYVPTQERIGGVPPNSAESGENIVKLDWAQLAGGVFSGAPCSTTEIAPAFRSALSSVRDPTRRRVR